MSENIQPLIDALPNLSAKSAEFANSLISQHAKRGLSPKQWFWVNKLATDASAPPVAVTQVGNVSAIVALLDTAKQHLKRPAILVRANDTDLRLNIAGSAAKIPGSINVCGTVKHADGRNDWYGRITREGEFQPSPKYDAQTQTAVAAALIALANDPVKAAGAYGSLTGVCCFCGRGLTDERSTKVGYGPICAGHWGLPWGTDDDSDI
jgi:Family of unknown function (DUF6011)